MATTTTIILTAFPAVTDDTLTARFIIRTAGTKGKGANAVSLDETETVDIFIVLDSQGRPVCKHDHIAAARLYAAVSAHKAAIEREHLAPYREKMSGWREIVDAIADGSRSGTVPPKPEKPDLPDDVQAEVDRLAAWLKSARKTWEGCRKYVLRCGAWYGHLSSAVQNRPGHVRMAGGLK